MNAMNAQPFWCVRVYRSTVHLLVKDKIRQIVYKNFAGYQAARFPSVLLATPLSDDVTFSKTVRQRMARNLEDCSKAVQRLPNVLHWEGRIDTVHTRSDVLLSGAKFMLKGS